MKKFLFSLCFIFFSLYISSQDQRFKIVNYGVEEGLSQGSNYSILKDRRGFLWFTSFEGLNRFDGNKFHIFRNDIHDSKSLKGSQTLGIVEDGFGNIWTGTEKCLNKLNRTKNEFEFVFTTSETGDSITSINYPFYS